MSFFFFFSVTIEIDSARFWRMDKVFASAVVIGRRLKKKNLTSIQSLMY